MRNAQAEALLALLRQGQASRSTDSFVHHACERARLPRIGPHRLRHTAASQMLRSGAPLTEIAQVLRHRSLLTTAVYAKIDLASLRTVAQPWPGGEA